jgi:hypothetical protein
MHNRPMCGRSAGTYRDLGDLKQRDLSGFKSHPTKKKTPIYCCWNSNLSVDFGDQSIPSYLEINTEPFDLQVLNARK